MAPSEVSKPVVGYVRVSTIEQAERGFGLAVQRERIELFCRAEGLALLAVEADPGVSGTTPLDERPGLSAAHAAASDGEVAALVVARFDRLARDTRVAACIEYAFEQALGVDRGRAVLYAEGLNGAAPGMEFMRDVMHAFAAEQRRQLVDRLAQGRRAKLGAGGYAHGRPPFGFVARGRQLVRDDAEAAWVRLMFERVARGESLRRVAVDLSGEFGRPWHPSTVQRIIRREVYKQGPRDCRVVDPRLWNRANARLLDRSVS